MPKNYINNGRCKTVPIAKLKLKPISRFLNFKELSKQSFLYIYIYFFFLKTIPLISKYVRSKERKVSQLHADTEIMFSLLQLIKLIFRQVDQETTRSPC